MAIKSSGMSTFSDVEIYLNSPCAPGGAIQTKFNPTNQQAQSGSYIVPTYPDTNDFINVWEHILLDTLLQLATGGNASIIKSPEQFNYGSSQTPVIYNSAVA